MNSISVILVAAVLTPAGVAFARDHQELVCSAVADAKDSGDRIPLFVHFFESRSSDGASRDERLSTIYQGALFQATRVNKSGGSSKEAPIVLKSGTAIRFRGTYTVENASGHYVLKLSGEVNDMPFAGKEFRTVKAALTCVDLSI